MCEYVGYVVGTEQHNNNIKHTHRRDDMSSEDGAPNSMHVQMQLQNQRAQMQQQQLQLHAFWQAQIQEIAQVDPNAFDFKTHQLPLARIKKIMKTDEDVRVRGARALLATV